MFEGLVTYSSPFVPIEWIAAHGLRPCRLTPLSEASDIHQGQCPFARSFVQAIERQKAGAAVFATTCDQMRRGSELLHRPDLPVFVMNVPATWQSPAAGKMYMAELRRLGLFLQSLGGTQPDDARLASVMLDYEQARRRLTDAAAALGARQFQESLRQLHQLPPADASNWSPVAVGQADGKTKTRDCARRIPLAVLGGPLPNKSLRLLDLIELSGGQVVLDATETGRRGLPAEPDRRRLPDDPLAEMAAMYFGGIGDAFRRPDSLLYEWLSRQIALCRPRGIILIHQVWCDLWHAQLAPLREWSTLPVLQIVDGGDDSARASASTRIESFMEILR